MFSLIMNYLLGGIDFSLGKSIFCIAFRPYTYIYIFVCMYVCKVGCMGVCMYV